MMELGFYMASTCFATQIASKNLLNKRTLFAKLKKNTYLYFCYKSKNKLCFFKQRGMEWFLGNGMVFGEWNGFSGNIKTTG